MSVEASPILDLIEAFRRSKTMFAAVSLGVFNELSSHPATCSALAQRLDCQPAALGRLLDGCVGLSLLSRVEEEYANTELAERYLTAASPETLAGYALYSEQTLYPLWSHLETAVREGSNRWEQTFGNRNALFDHFFRDETAQRSFLQGMDSFGRLSHPKVVRMFDLKEFHHLADLGGATASLCIAACEKYPQLTATVFDLPPVEGFATEKIAQSNMADRVKFVGGDFFTDSFPPADLYALGRILHDWDEDKIRRLLKKIYEALPSRGGLLIAEALLDDDRCGPMGALMQNLNMLVCTDGKERTCSEYRSLLDAAGFRAIQCRRTGSVVDAVLARKP